MIERLTDEQLAILPKQRDKWLKIGLSTEPLDFEEAKKAACEAYKVVGLEPPKYFYRFESPYSAAIGICMLKNLPVESGDQVWNQVSSKVGIQVYDQASDQVYDQVSDQVWDQVSDQVWKQVYYQVWDQVRDQVIDQASEQASEQAYDQVWDQVSDQVIDQASEQAYDQVSDQVSDQVIGQVWDQVREQVREQVIGQVYDQVRDQVREQVWNQAQEQVYDQVLEQFYDQVSSQVWDQVWDQVRDQVSDQVWDQVSDQVWSQVSDQVWDQVWDQAWSQVSDQVSDQVWSQVSDQVKNMIYGCHDAGWLSFYETFLMLGISECKKLKPLIDLANHSGWWSAFKNIVIFQDRPEFIKFDDQNLLHSESGPAIKYRDGFSVYCWHGTRIPSEWIEDKNHLTPEICFNWENADQRVCAFAIYGWDKILDSVEHKVIDEDYDPKIGKLVEADFNDGMGPRRFIVAHCPTGRAISVPVDHERKYSTALEANAATYGCSPEQYRKYSEFRT